LGSKDTKSGWGRRPSDWTPSHSSRAIWGSAMAKRRRILGLQSQRDPSDWTVPMELQKGGEGEWSGAKAPNAGKGEEYRPTHRRRRGGRGSQISFRTERKKKATTALHGHGGEGSGGVVAVVKKGRPQRSAAENVQTYKSMRAQLWGKSMF